MDTSDSAIGKIWTSPTHARGKARRRSALSVRNSRRHLLFESLEDRALLAGDIQARFEFTDTAGTPVSTLQTGNDYLLRMHVSDVRTSAAGIRRAFFDVNYGASLISLTGPIVHGPLFNLGGSTSGSTATSGLIDEVGGFDTDQIPPTPANAEGLLFHVPFRANNTGTLNVSGNLADLPSNMTLLFDKVAGSLENDITYVGGSIEILGAGIVVTPTTGLVTTEAGGTATFNLVLSNQPTSDVTIGLSSSNTNEGIVNLSSVTFTSANWNIPRTVTVTGVDDSVVDGNSSYSIVTSSATSGDPRYNGFNPSDVAVTNQDNDIANLTITAPTITETNADQTVNFTVSLDKAIPGGFTVAFNAASGTAILGTDFTVNGTSPLSFTGAAGETKNIAITIRGDQIVESNETFTVSLGTVSLTSAPAGSVTTGAPATGTINNDDTAILTLTAPTITETNADQTVNFTVSVDKAVAGGFSLAFTNQNGTADAADYTITTTSPLSFTGNAAESKTIAVTIKGDQIVEGNETFTITLGAVTAGSVPASSIQTGAIGTGTIGNDDTATLTLTAPSITESNTNQTVTFTATLDKAVAGGFNVAFNTANGTATSGLDFSLATASPLSFTGTVGETKSVSVTIAGDQIVEGNETFTITLGAVTPSGSVAASSITSNASATGTITNDDVATVTLVAPTITESNVDQTVNFSVVLDKEVAGGFQLSFNNTNGTADANDYVMVTTSPLTFAGTAGETKNIAVTIRGDQIVEANESFTVALGTVTPVSPVLASSISLGTSATASIQNDDVATLTVTAPAITETNIDQTVNVIVSIDKAVAGGFSVAFTNANGTAASADYSVVTSSPLSFTGSAGESKSISVIIRGDQIVEGNEAFTLTLGTVTSATVPSQSIVSGATTTATITNDDFASLTLTAPTITETDANQTVQFTVSLNRAVEGGFTVAFQDVPGSAGASDYQVSTVSPLTFNGTAGETKNISVVITGDQIVEANETFAIALSALTPVSPVLATSIELGSPVQGTILNDDSATLTITPLTITESNSDQTVNFVVTVDNPVAGGFSVDFSNTNGTAGASDYSITSVSPLNFVGTAGETQQITAVIKGDQVVEGSETFTVALGAISKTAVDVPVSQIQSGASTSGTIVNDDTAGLSFVIPNISESSLDQTFKIGVQLDQPVSGGFSVSFSNTNGTAGASDYSIDSASPLVFQGTAGEIQNITVTIRGDDVPEGHENFSLALGTITTVAPVSAASITSPPTATVTIQDDDTATLTLTAPTITESGADQTVNFTVTLDKPIPGGFTVAFSAANGTASSSDYTVNTAGPVSFTGTPGETKQISVTIHGDAVVEGDETFTITLGTVIAASVPASGITTGASATAVIQNDDTATLIITEPAITETNTDQIVEFQVQLDNAVEGGFTVAFHSENGNAGDSDFAFNATSPLTFTGVTGEIKLISVTIRGDRTVEASESFSVRLGTVTTLLPEQVADILSGDVATGVIENDDSTSVSISSIALPEGNGGGSTQFAFEVRLADGVEGGFDLDFDVQDLSAIAGPDYSVATTGPLQFAGNENETQIILVQVAADAQVEPDELFRVALGSLSALAAGIDSNLITLPANPVTGTILNDDSAVISIADVTQAEGSTGGTSTLEIPVSLSQPVAGGFDVAFNVQAITAALGADFTVITASPLHFAGTAGEVQSITIQVNADSIVETDETLQAVLGAITNLSSGIDPGLVTIGNATASATISNDDSATVTINDVTQLETDAGQTQLLFTVTLSAPVDVPVSVDFTTVDRTARVIDGDYESVSGTLDFTPGGALTQTVTVTVNGDILVELDETFAVQLSNLQAGSPLRNVVLERTEGIGTIDADDGTLVEITDAQLIEGDSGTQQLVFTVTASKPVGQTVTIGFATENETANTADGDFDGQQGTITLVPGGELTQTISITVHGDQVVELDETFRVVLGEVSPNIPDVLLNRPIGRGLLQNNDTATIRIENVSATEGDAGTTAFHFAVTLSQPVDTDISVAFSTVDGTARATDGDYQSNSGTLVFRPGEPLTQNITVVVNADTTVEPSELFEVVLNNLLAGNPARSVSLENTTATGTIINDDVATLSISVTQQAAEGGANGVITIATNRRLQEALTLSLNIAGSAVPGTDYQPINTSIVFPADTDSITIPVTLLADQLIEGDESVVVTLLAPNSQVVVVGSSNAATVSIADNDSATLAIESSKSIPEQGGQQSVVVTLTTSDGEGGTAVLAPGVALQASVAAVAGSATAADFSSLATQTVSFAPGSGDGSTFNVTVAPVNDTLVEGNETAQLQLQGLQSNFDGQVTIGTSNSAITLVDNDTATIAIEATKTVTEQGGAQTILVTLTTSDGAGGTATLAPGVSIQADVVDTATGTATSALDYAAISTLQLNFANGAGNGDTRSVTLMVTNDTLVEGDETVQLRLQNLQAPAGGQVTLGTADSLVTIDDNDTATLSIEATKSVAEAGGAQSILVTLTTSDGAGGTATLAPGVTLQAQVVDAGGGTAQSGTDYTAFGNQAASFAAGTGNGAVAMIPLTLTNDTLVEGNETVQLRLQTLQDSLDGQVSLGNANSAVTIQDNDTATISIEATKTVTEQGGAQTITVTLTTSDGAGGTATLAPGISVQAEVIDTAAGTAGTSDYTAFGTQTVSFAAGTGNGATATVSVNATNDTLIEGNETIQLRLQNLTPTGTPVALGNVNSNVTIQDNDTAQIAIESTKTVTEQGGAQTIVVTMTTSDGAGGTATLAPGVTLTASVVDAGTGTASGADLSFGSQTLTFTAGAGNGATSTVNFNITNDTLVEGAETVNLRLQNLQGPAGNPATLGNANAVVTIQDNDTATVSIETSKTINEAGGSQTVIVTLTTSDGAGGTATLAPGITVQADVVDLGGGSATSGTDYTAIGTKSVSFSPGAANGATATVALAITNDSLVEGNETIRLRMQNLRPTTPGVVTLGNADSVATIQDNDTAILAIQATKTVLEQNGAQTITVTLTTSDGAGGSATLAPGVTISANVVDAGGGTAVSGTDYQAFGTQTVTFTSSDGNNTSKTVSITPIRDSQLDPDRTVNLRLQALSQTLNGQVSLGNTVSLVTIRDNPATSELRGFVFVDLNNNGQRETTEFGIPGVTITLTGTDSTGRSIQLVAMTADDGSYGFIALPAGTYSIVETAPAVYLDSSDTIGTQGGVAGNDQFTNIQLDFDEIGRDNNFGERGLESQWVSIRLFLGSTVVDSSGLRSLEANGMDSDGNSNQADAIRDRSIPSVVSLPTQPAGEGESAPSTSSASKSAPAVPLGEGESSGSFESTSEDAKNFRHNSNSTTAPANISSRTSNRPSILKNPTTSLVSTSRSALSSGTVPGANVTLQNPSITQGHLPEPISSARTVQRVPGSGRAVLPAEDNAFDALVWDDRRDIYFSKELTETNETDKSRDSDSLNGEFAHSEYLDAKDAHDDFGRKDSKQPSNESLRDATEEVFSQLGTDFDLFADEHEGIE